MKRTILLTIAILSVAALATTAQAQSTQTTSGAGRFARADANRDGRVTFGEFESFMGARLMKAKGARGEKFRSLNPEQQVMVLQKRFQKLDHGHKGYLEPADWQPHRRS